MAGEPINLLLFVPIIFAGNVFGLVGSFGAALTGIALTILDELLIHHSTVEFWGEWGVLITALIVAIQVGHQYEVERHQRLQLRLAERTTFEIELQARLTEADAHKRIAHSAELFRGAFENNTSGMFLLDRVGRFINVNRAFCEMIGYAVDDLLGHSPNEFTHPDDDSLFDETRRRLAAGETARGRHSMRYRHRDGRVLFGELSMACISDFAGKADTFVASVRDATDERALIDELEHQALYDPLTGLANRTLFEDRLSRARANVVRNGGSTAVFLLDLDDFKEVNDTFGHHVGDELLIEFARRMEQVTRASDTLCRFGGDEFLYLAEGLTGSYEEIAERLLSVVSEPFDVAGTRLEQRVSIGVVAVDIDTMDNEELLRNVDTALYGAKRQGRGRFVRFTSDMHDRASSRFELLRDLRAAVGTDQLSTMYQPLVDLATREIVGFEALMRWRHPENGFIAPDTFIPVAEQTDLILKLGEFAIREATREAASWMVTGGVFTVRIDQSIDKSVSRPQLAHVGGRRAQGERTRSAPSRARGDRKCRTHGLREGDQAAQAP